MMWKNKGITQFRKDLTSVVSNIINCIENRALDKESINTVERLQECCQLKFGLSEKHTKLEKIFLMLWMFTK